MPIMFLNIFLKMITKKIINAEINNVVAKRMQCQNEGKEEKIEEEEMVLEMEIA